MGWTLPSTDMWRGEVFAIWLHCFHCNWYPGNWHTLEIVYVNVCSRAANKSSVCHKQMCVNITIVVKWSELTLYLCSLIVGSIVQIGNVYKYILYTNIAAIWKQGAHWLIKGVTKYHFWAGTPHALSPTKFQKLTNEHFCTNIGIHSPPNT